MRTLAIASILFAATVAFADVEVNTCGQMLSGDGFLAADLDCSAIPAAVTIIRGRLALSGFSVLGAPIECLASCTVEGPGSVAGVLDGIADSTTHAKAIVVKAASVDGDVGWANEVDVSDANIHGLVSGKNVTISSSTISDSDRSGVVAEQLTLTDSIVRNNAWYGIADAKRAKVVRSDISDNGLSGIACVFNKPNGRPNNYRDLGKIDIYDSTVIGNGFGSDVGLHDGISCAQRVVAERTTIQDNAGAGVDVSGEQSFNYDGVDHRYYGKAYVRDSIVSGNATGVHAFAQAIVLRSSVTASQFSGVESEKRVLLNDSHVHGSATDPRCGSTIPCADVQAGSKPILKNGSSCDTSLRGLGETWGVCSLD